MINEDKQLIKKNPFNYKTLITNIGEILEKGRKDAIKIFNNILVKTYWEIGKQIIEYEQKGEVKAEYGSELLNNLSKDLSLKYGKGFKKSNVYMMRLFYLKYPKFQTLSGKLSWSHYIELLGISYIPEREFYEKQCINENWSIRELKRQKNSMLFERLELGKGFTFVARQFRLTLDNTHYYVDLVFYHRILKCFVLIDLKIGKANHVDIGQMNMYLNYFKEEEKSNSDNEPIGIILSADKDDILVKYALGSITNRLFVSKCKIYLPDKEELVKKVRNLL